MAQAIVGPVFEHFTRYVTQHGTHWSLTLSTTRLLPYSFLRLYIYFVLADLLVSLVHARSGDFGGSTFPCRLG